MTSFQARLAPFLLSLALAASALPFGFAQAQGFSSVSSGAPKAAIAASADAGASSASVPILASATTPPPAFGGALPAGATAVPTPPGNAGSASPAIPAPAAPAPTPVAPGRAAASAFSAGGGGFNSVSGGAPSLPPATAASASYGAGSASAFEMADKVLVIKHERVLRLLRRGRVIAEYPIKLGLNPYGHKQREGDFRTPEGHYDLVARNPRSEFFLSIKISYPNREDAAVAHESGNAPGGLIMIHGQPNEPKRPTEYYATRDWTDGCIALSNADMVDVWLRTTAGIPIEIRK
jgi:L,D-transpeptidase catalytic domain